ncbi:sialidase family protein [Paenibacillus thermotolerans]|uniref:sialidase family protein n=1 Tax=Paenibacillus thermotolerans TaxID=3027807 RepID=UPI002368B0F5|nr:MULTISPECIES: sialidase family protein [unclassified Paenibacillus]
MGKRVLLLIGTNKGVFYYSSDPERKNWSLHGPFLSGWEAYSVMGDSRQGNRLFAGTSHAAYGATIRYSDDFGESWTQVENGPSYSKESGFSLNRIWQLIPGADRNTVFAGAEEAGLFVSRDRGATWTELDALTKHPTRPGWFPGAGGMCLHTIIIDPRNADRMWVAMSAVGVFRTEDGGKSWHTANKGLARVPTGQPYDEIGYCIHKMVMDPQDPDILYMQEHGGVFMSKDGGDNWFPIEEGLTLTEGGAPFGFPISVAPNGDLFLVPLESSEVRSTRGGKLLVYGRPRGGDRWDPIGDVVPEEQRHVSVLRDAMAVDSLEPYGLYFGTTSGEVFCSLDQGRTWDRLPGQLSRILSVKPWIVEE